MGERKSVTIEIREPEKVYGQLLKVLAHSAFNDGVGQWIETEADVDVPFLDDDEKVLWNVMQKIKEQL